MFFWMENFLENLLLSIGFRSMQSWGYSKVEGGLPG
jgi:hypothetical protein